MRILLAAALLAGSATAAAAQCAPADLTGSWSLIGSNGGTWVICPLTVDAEGVFEGRCRGSGRPKRGNPIEGFLELADDCEFTGQWTIQRQKQQIEGALAEGSGVGSGVVHFGPKRQNLGLHFTLVRTGE